MVPDWLKTLKKPLTTNQIRAVLATKFKKMFKVFSRRRRDLIICTQNNNRKVKIYSKNPNNGSKKYVSLAKCIENALLREK